MQATKVLSFLSILFLSVILWTAPAYAVGDDMPQSLQGLIDKAKEGDTLQLQDKTYLGPININKRLIIEGNGACIKATTSGNTVELRADGIELNDISVLPAREGIDEKDAAIWVGSNGNIIQNCVVQESYYGIHLENAQNNVFVGNHILGDPEQKFNDKGAGIMSEYSSNNEFVNNRIENVGDGIYFYYSYSNIIKKNFITEARYAIHLMDDSKNNKIISNKLEHNITGIMTMLAQDTLIIGNEITNQYDYHGTGIIIYSSERTSILQNLVSDNTRGIQMSDSWGTLMKENNVRTNYAGLVLGECLQATDISRNNFIGNIQQYTAVEDSTSPVAEVKGNYWDDYNGFDENGDGIGDKIYQHGKTYFEIISGARENLQVFFNSPAMVMLASIQSMDKSSAVYDPYPLMKPVITDTKAAENPATSYVDLHAIVGLIVFLAGCVTTIVLGRGHSWKN